VLKTLGRRGCVWGWHTPQEPLSGTTVVGDDEVVRHPFRVREIAAQAGVSEATVDRVLHGRDGVRPSTTRQVERALAELHRQADQLQLGGRTWLLDVIVQAPLRFSVEVRAALEAELPLLRPAVVRSRFALLDGPGSTGPTPVVAALQRAARTGSDGVVVKAGDDPAVVVAVADLASRGVPVVTLVTDLPTSARVAYIGLDNLGAGATAAHLVSSWLGDEEGEVLVVRGRGASRAEDERARGFSDVLAGPRCVVDAVDDEEDGTVVAASVRSALAADRGSAAIRAVYSMYSGAGGTAAVLDALADCGVPRPRVVVVHDLAADHLALLRVGRVDVVLHHDLRTDLRRAARTLLQARGAAPGRVRSWPAPVGVVTRYNLPLR
jgi:LacI family transcriptional regulator